MTDQPPSPTRLYAAFAKITRAHIVPRVAAPSAQKDRAEKLRCLAVYVGYAPEDLQSKAFQDHIKTHNAFMKTYLPDALFSFHHLIPPDALDFHVDFKPRGPATVQLSPRTFTDAEKDILRRRTTPPAGYPLTSARDVAYLQQIMKMNNAGEFDVVIAYINPAFAGGNYFGFGGIVPNTPGPEKQPDGRFVLFEPVVAAHEILHSLYFNRPAAAAHVPYMGDGYARDVFAYEADLIKRGQHSEFFVANPRAPSKPMPIENPLVRRVAKHMKPVWYDTNCTLIDENGKKCRLLSPQANETVMSVTVPVRHPSPFQKALIEEIAISVLIAKGRLPDSARPPYLSKPASKTRKAFNSASKPPLQDTHHAKSGKRHIFQIHKK